MNNTIIALAICAIITGLSALTLGAILLGTKLLFNAFFKRPKKQNSSPVPSLPKGQVKMYEKLMGTTMNEFIDYVKTNIKKIIDIERQELEILSDDGLKLKGYFTPAPTQSDITVLCIHGYKSDGMGDFSGMFPVFREKNYNYMTINHRAHGKSEGEYIGFGVLDYHDTRKWIDEINKLVPNGKIILYGVSMGAATTMHLSELDLPENVVCAVSDCGFTSVWDEFSFQLKNLFKLPAKPILNLVESWCIHQAKYDFTTETPLKAVANAKVPILFIHGENDVFVPTFMVNQCYDACPSEKELLIVKEAGHAQSHMTDPKLYEETFFTFVEKYLNAAK
ncbi:MAG: alpha/beta hydrolase [Christensenellales bacterium]|nr:alpha/beta hydrolase [Clostridiales bacterium]